MSSPLDNLAPEIRQKYYDMGRKLGTSTDQTLDVDLIWSLTNAHRAINSVELIPRENMIVYDSPKAACTAIPSLRPSNAFFGSMDAGWLTTALCAKLETGYARTAQIEALIELTKHVGWFWMSSSHTVITYRPTEIHLITDSEGADVLHNWNDLAMKFRDGSGVAAFNGVRIPQAYLWLLKPADTLTKKAIAGIDGSN